MFKAYSDSHENHHTACKLDFLQKSSLSGHAFRYNE